MFIVYIQIAIAYKFPVLATQLTAGHIELSFYGPNICWRKKIGNSKKTNKTYQAKKNRGNISTCFEYKKHKTMSIRNESARHISQGKV